MEIETVMTFATRAAGCLVPVMLLTACASDPGLPEARGDRGRPGADPHSFSRPHAAIVDHLKLDIAVDFETQRIHGRAVLHFENLNGTRELWLDTRGLDIERVSLGEDDTRTEFRLGDETPLLGRALIVSITPHREIVNIYYSSRPDAEALQWLDAAQTAGGRYPFLLSQSQAILARTWIPCQDTPAVRMTYDATVRVPQGMMAVMSATNPTTTSPDGVYNFTMDKAIPSYLLALAVGELEFRPLGPRSGVYAEPQLIDRAAWEFAETKTMIVEAERIYGPYRWSRYDLLLLPAGFPFGGMENPRLTFVTPTILAGDRSLVSLVAHELAHSWSGNLVTNATWDDFWLNEGFTVYAERRVMERLHGREYAEMLAMLGYQDLLDDLELLGEDSPDTRLSLDLAGRDPNIVFTDIAYEKGYLFLRMLEESFGREAWDEFLAGYFDRFAFRSITTDRFVTYLETNLLAQRAAGAKPEDDLRLDEWIHRPGLPENAPRLGSQAFERVAAERAAWLAGRPAGELSTGAWSAHEWLYFIRGIPPEASRGQLADLDGAYGLTDSGNSEIRFAWLLQAIRHDYDPAFGAVDLDGAYGLTDSGNSEIRFAWLLQAIRHDYDPAFGAVGEFLSSMGRGKFLSPLYTALAETSEGLARGRSVYGSSRSYYHPVARARVDEILGWPW